MQKRINTPNQLNSAANPGNANHPKVEVDASKVRKAATKKKAGMKPKKTGPK